MATKGTEDTVWRTALAAHGFAPGPDGWDEAGLRAAIAARGWTIRLEEAAPFGTDRRVRRWTALLVRPHRRGWLDTARARGRSVGEALARALGHVLGREDRHR